MAARNPRRAPLMPLAGLGIVLVAAITAFLISHNMAEANEDVGRAVEIRVGLTELGADLALHDAAFRGYLISANPIEAGQARAARATLIRRFARLHRLLDDEPAQQAALSRLAPLIGQRFRQVERQMIEKARGGSGQTPAADRLRVRALLTAIDARLRQMSAAEQAQLERRQARAQRLVSWLSLALAGAVLLVVLAAWLTAFDARQRFVALRTATREARASAVEAARQTAGRNEAEEQLRQIQKMESIGQLTGGIAHDFNNMLAVIVGSLDLARRRIADPDKAARHISDALEGAGRATTLVSRLLAFSRRQALSPTAIESEGFVADLGELLRRMLGETIAVELAIAPATWPIFADRVQLESAMLNLAVNARDAMPQGGTLTIATANRSLRPGAETLRSDLIPGDYVELAVTDSGAGMDEAVVARAFDPFFTTKAVGKGTGLGLSQVFGFVRQSGGHVTIASALGQGTSVRLLLPRHGAGAGADGARPDHPPAAGAPAGRGERVLLVEDDDRVRRFSADALRELGYVPIAAANGAEALRLLGDQPDIAILFTDVVMPGMSGQELAAAVRASRPGIRLLFTTGYARDETDRLGLARLDAPVLMKPFAVAELGQRLRELLET